MNLTPENDAQKLWQCQPVEGMQMSIQEIRKRSGKLERRVLWRNLREYVAAVFAIIMFTYFFVERHDLLYRTAFALFIASMFWIAIQLYRRASAKRMPTGMDASTSLQFYRAELVRQRDVVKNVWPWYLAPLVPGFAALTLADVVSLPYPANLVRPLLTDVAVAAVFFGVWKMNLRAARCLDRMIGELGTAEQ
jgi:hypothetical protein